MKETQITCLCNRIELPDLGLVMTKGQVEFLDSARAARSGDLQRARRNKGVEVREVQRVRERRSARGRSPSPVPASNWGDGVPRKSISPSSTPSGTLVVEAKVDLGEIAQVVRAEVSGAIKEAILQEGRSYSIGSSAQGNWVGPVMTEPEPVFVPEGIVDKTTKTDIQVESGESEATGLDAAAKALKGRKKTKKKTAKPTKKTEG